MMTRTGPPLLLTALRAVQNTFPFYESFTKTTGFHFIKSTSNANTSAVTDTDDSSFCLIIFRSTFRNYQSFVTSPFHE